MDLIYTPKAGFTGPPFPWPARDHWEENAATAERKMDSGFYRSHSGKEIKERQKEEGKAKAAANTKAAEELHTEAVDARASAVSAERAAVQAAKNAEEAEAKAEATASRRGGK